MLRELKVFTYPFLTYALPNIDDEIIDAHNQIDDKRRY